MIWFILYVIVAAAAVFGLVLLSLLKEKRCRWCYVELWPSFIFGIIWPIGAPVYGAYLFAAIYADHLKNGDKE